MIVQCSPDSWEVEGTVREVERTARETSSHTRRPRQRLTRNNFQIHENRLAHSPRDCWARVYETALTRLASRLVHQLVRVKLWMRRLNYNQLARRARLEGIIVGVELSSAYRQMQDLCVVVQERPTPRPWRPGPWARVQPQTCSRAPS